MISQRVTEYRLLIVFFLMLLTSLSYGQTTSWRGTTSTAWATAANWTNGVPTATLDAIVGDANFTGTFQPSVTATAACRSLTVGGGTRATTLTVNALLNVNSNLNIAALGTLRHTANTISLRGNWTNTGTYNPTVAGATVVFSGTTQAINSATSFRRLTINSGSTTSLGASITVVNAFVVSGIFDPVTSTNLVTLAGSTFTVNGGGRIRVFASLFSGNYSINPTLNATSVVEYAATSTSQTIATLSYGTLTISGGSVKTLAANTVMQSTSAAAGRVNLNAGTLDIGAFTLNRNATGGGTFVVSNGAQLIIGGTNTFPANYNTYTLGATSQVVYGGTNQAISSKTYGHLVLRGTTGGVIKTFPATAMTVAGDLTATLGSASSLTLTATAALTVSGNVSLGNLTTFNAGAGTHNFAGNFSNAGIFNGNTGTARFTGAARVISGGGVLNFNNLTVTGAGVTCSSTSVTVTGNLATTGTGTFTHNDGGTLTLSGATKTITGTGHSLFNLVVSGTVSARVPITIRSNMTTTGTFDATAGTITFSGASPVIGGAGSTTFFALQLNGQVSTAVNISIRSAVSGTGKLTATAGTVSFIGTSLVSGTHDLFNVTINGTRLQLAANATLRVAGAFTITAGTLNTTTTTPNTFVYNGSGNQNIAAATYNNLILATGGTKTAAGATTTGSNLTINPGVTFNGATFTHTVSGNWINNGTFVPATSTVAFNGALNTSTTGTTTFNNLTLNKSTTTTTVTLNNSITTNNLTMTNGRMLTGANSVTITGTRTGNAVILGTITRTHTFLANTAYAFESSFNTITFTSISGSVTSVTVNVVSATVSDFPAQASVNRSYTVNVTRIGSYVANVRMHYEDTELNGNAEANMSLWRFSGGWVTAGKSANDVNNNWVQQTSFTDITGRWTFSDGSTIQVWKGTTSTAWNTASNWKSGVVPGVNDNILIGTETFTNQPTITTAVTSKSIFFGSIKAATLTIGGGAGSLNVTGNMTGDWLADQVHAIAVGARSLSVGGDVTLSNGSATRSIQLSLSTGTITISGSLNQSGSGSVSFTGNGNLLIGNAFNYTAGTFSAGTGTVTYNGTVDQVIAGGLTYNNLAIFKTAGIATLPTASTVNGSLTVSGASNVNINAALDVAGNVDISAGATVTTNNATMRVGGNWNRSGSFNSADGVVVLNGAATQTIVQTTFNDLVINKTGGVVTPANDLVINGDLSINSGVFDIGAFSVNRSAAGGTLTIGDGATLRVGGASNFPANYDAQLLTANSTVIFNGTAAQSVPAMTYGSLVFANGGATAKSLAGDIQVNGDLTINTGATFDGAGRTVSLQGSWTNSGSFTPAAGTVELLGTSKSITGSTTFSSLNISGSYTASTGTALTVNGLANVPGTLNAGTNPVTFSGDVILDGTLRSDGDVIFSGTQVQTIDQDGALVSPSLTNTVFFNGSVSPVLVSTIAPTFTHVTINNTAGVTANQPWTVVGNFTVNTSGRWNGSTPDHTFRATFTNSGIVTGSGKFNIVPGLPIATGPVVITLGSGTSFQNTGTVEFGGANALSIVGTPSAFNDVIFSNTNASGITAAGDLNINGDLTVATNARFMSGSGRTHTVKSNLLVNGLLDGNTSTFILSPVDTAQIGGSGTINFYDIRVNGVVEATANFNVERNMVSNASFLPGDATVNFTGTTPGQVGGPVTTRFTNVSINKPSSTLSLSGNISSIRTLTVNAGTLDLLGFSVTENTGTGGSLSMDANTTLVIGSVNTMPVFTLGYTFDASSTVQYNGGAQAIAPIDYANLLLSNPGSKTFSATTATEVNTLTNATTAVLPNLATLRLNGHWVNNGTFTIGATSNILFKGASTQNIGGSSVTDFVNVNVTNLSSPGVSVETNQNLRGVLTLASNVTVDADGGSNSSVLRLISTGDSPTRDAAIATLPAGASVTGNVTVQRFMTIEGASGGRIYRYISAPVRNATVADMQNEIPISGNFTGRSLCTGCTTTASMFSYDETVITNGIDGGYVAFPVTTNTEVFQPGRGYAMFVRGNLIPTALWDLRGPINSGLISMPVSFTSSGTIANDGWNLVGNPYPATIDWNAATGWTKTNINATVYIRDNAVAGGQYATWNGLVGTNGGSRYIAAGQAFWVKASSSSPALSLNENTKVAGTQTSFFRKTTPENFVRVTLAQGSVRDEAIVHFREDATSNFDDHADAIKLPNTGFNVSTQLSGKDKLAINSLSTSFCSASVGLAFDNVPAGNYTLTFGELASFNDAVDITLADAFTGTESNLLLDSTYVFSVTTNPASSNSSRFTLRFVRQVAPMDYLVSATTVCKGSDALIELTKTSGLASYSVSVNERLIAAQPGNGGSIGVTVSSEALITGINRVSVVATPLNGCGESITKTVTFVSETVSAPTAGVGPSICREGSATLTATGAAAGQRYQWYAKPDDTSPLFTGGGFTTPTLQKTQTFYVSVITNAGCESERVPVTATVIHYNDPIIVLRNDSLTVNVPGKKQWYLNDALLANDTLSSLKPKTDGNYTVRVSVGQCMSETSFIYVTAGGESDWDASVDVYPNPVSEVLYFRHDRAPVTKVQLMNLSGQVVGTLRLNQQGTATTGELDMSPFASGIYLVQIFLPEGVKMVKVQKR